MSKVTPTSAWQNKFHPAHLFKVQLFAASLLKDIFVNVVSSIPFYTFLQMIMNEKRVLQKFYCNNSQLQAIWFMDYENLKCI